MRCRLLFMRHLYTVTQGQRLDARPANGLGSELGWTPEETDPITDYLSNEGLIEFAGGGDGGQVAITHLGIQEVEHSLASPESPTEHFPAASSIMVVQGDVLNSQVQVGTVASHQVQHLSNDEIRAIQAFIERLDTDLPGLGLTHEQASDVRADIDTVRAQLGSSKPKRGILRESLVTLRSVAQGVAGNAAFAGLVELASHVHL